MSDELSLFYSDLQAEISNAASEGKYHIEAFIDTYVEELINTGEVFDIVLCDNPKHNGVYVNACYSDQFNDGAGVRIDLFVTDYDQRLHLEKLNKKEINLWFKRLMKFFTESYESEFYKDFDISSSTYDFAEYIWQHRNIIEQVNLFFLSERVLSERVQDFEKIDIPGINVKYHLYDIEKLFNLKNSTKQRESIELNFLQQYGQGIDCLTAHLGSGSLESYLAVIPGEMLARVYNDYGERLLEQNVRSFLQAKGKVNKGIRDTILKEPSYFFSYNNGITATASHIETEQINGQTQIVKVVDLQIVNGGQTTASLGRALSRDNVDLSNIFVQMKISVVDDAKSDVVVPKISEYANTQNKVNLSDLSANHPYHIKIEELSRKIWAPAKDGELRETSWFYERSRGQYNVMLAATDSKKEKNKYPKAQMFNKTELAKYMMVWDYDEPKWVNMGAQKNFVKFSEIISKDWKNESFANSVNEFYFKKLISRAIIFKNTEKMVMKQSWYANGYRANIVIYSLAYLSDFLKRHKKDLNYLSIWNRQSLSLPLQEVIKDLAKNINEILTMPNASRTTNNISEWAKKDGCWLDIKNNHREKLDRCIYQPFMDELLDIADVRDLEKDAAKDEKDTNQLKLELLINTKGKEFWAKFLAYVEPLKTLSYTQRDILEKAIKGKMLNNRQCQTLHAIFQEFEVDFLAEGMG